MARRVMLRAEKLRTGVRGSWQQGCFRPLSVHVYLEAAGVSYSNTPGGNFPPTLVIDIHGASAQQQAQQLTHGGFTADSADTCPQALAALGAQH